MEQAVGKTLLLRDRTGSNVSATEDGELMLAYARRLLAIADEAQQVLSAPRSARVLRLGVPEDFDVARLTVLLAKFSARHPDLRLETVSGMSAGYAMPGGGRAGSGAGQARTGRWSLPGSMAGSLGMVGEPRIVREAASVPLVLFPQGCIYRKRMIYALESAGRAWHAAYHSHSLPGCRRPWPQDWASACCRPTRACRVRPCWAGSTVSRPHRRPNWPS